MAHVDRLLDPRTRLVGFLSSLALSMTCGAAILHWIEPAESMTATQAALLASRREEVREAVKTNPPPDEARWQEIQLEPRPLSIGSSGRALAAQPERRGFHFVIDLTGRINLTTSWRRQQPVAGAPQAIRICLGGLNGEGFPTRDQCESLRELLAALRRECHIPSERVELVGDHGFDDPAFESTRARLRRSLLAAGVLG